MKQSTVIGITTWLRSWAALFSLPGSIIGRETVYLCYDLLEVFQSWGDRNANEPRKRYPSTDQLGPRRRIQDVSLQISVTNCVPLRGYTKSTHDINIYKSFSHKIIKQIVFVSFCIIMDTHGKVYNMQEKAIKAIIAYLAPGHPQRSWLRRPIDEYQRCRNVMYILNTKDLQFDKFVVTGGSVDVAVQTVCGSVAVQTEWQLW